MIYVVVCVVVAVGLFLKSRRGDFDSKTALGLAAIFVCSEIMVAIGLRLAIIPLALGGLVAVLIFIGMYIRAVTHNRPTR